jgi:hypothetical protein
MKMMSCQHYVFLLSSGQLDEADTGTRWQAGLHRLMCRHCRAFTRNDQALDAILKAARERAMAPQPPDQA